MADCDGAAEGDLCDLRHIAGDALMTGGAPAVVIVASVAMEREKGADTRGSGSVMMRAPSMSSPRPGSLVLELESRHHFSNDRAYLGGTTLSLSNYRGWRYAIVRQSCGQIGHHGQAENLGAQLPSRDGFQRTGHPDEIGADGSQHPDLCRSLEVGPWNLGIHPFGEGPGNIFGERPKTRRPSIHEIDEGAP
jgi:hypothetical protein